MTRRKHGHRKNIFLEAFRERVSVIISTAKPRKRRGLSEGIRLMTPEEELAAIQAITLPKSEDPAKEVIINENEEDLNPPISHIESSRKQAHRREPSKAGFMKWILGSFGNLETRKRHGLSEGTRLMTPEEELASIQAAWAPRLNEDIMEVPIEVPDNNPQDIAPVLTDIPGEILPENNTKTHNHQIRKRKPKRWWRILGRRGKNTPVLIELSLTSQLNPETVEKKKKYYSKYLKPTVNSTALFVIAYFIVWFTYQFGVMIQASFSDIDSVLYYYEVMFPVGNYSHLWSQFNIILITAAGPMLSVIMGLLYRYVFMNRLKPGTQMRQLLVWLYLVSMAFFFGAFVAGIITNQGFGYVAGWLYMNIVFRIGISLIFLFILGFQGWKTLRHLPEVSGSDSFKRNRRMYVLSRLTIPWLVGSIFILVLKHTSFVPQHPNIYEYDAIIIGSMLFPVVAAIFNKRERPMYFRNPRHSTSTRTVVIAVMFAVLITFLVRFGLSQGLYLKLKILLDISMYR